ncbi:hypothetical protein ACQP3F_32740, partial [Escherichia coli]
YEFMPAGPAHSQASTGNRWGLGWELITDFVRSYAGLRRRSYNKISLTHALLLEDTSDTHIPLPTKPKIY